MADLWFDSPQPYLTQLDKIDKKYIEIYVTVLSCRPHLTVTPLSGILCFVPVVLSLSKLYTSQPLQEEMLYRELHIYYSIIC